MRAPNVDKDQYVIVVRVGGRLPGGVKIKRAKLRGEVSEGMICSLQEIGIDANVMPKNMQMAFTSSQTNQRLVVMH